MGSELGKSAAAQLAVIGASCRFPGADGIDEFWQLLCAGGDAVSEVPATRYDVESVYDPRPATPGKTVSRSGGFIADPFGFDAAFFGISPIEAIAMDPQQRLLLQVAWEALEDAGVRPSSLAGSRCGVFVGQATADYSEQHHGPMDVRQSAGSRLRAITAGRLSFALDVRGPSLTIDTACSSSLAAVHLARQSLMSHEVDLAIVGGVNLILSPADSITYSQGNMLSPNGRCRFADQEADGFVRSEGIGVVILKRLPEATHEHDPVRAVLLGSALNNDGQGSGLLLQPAISGQAAMLRQACESADLAPADIDYIEAHGTGTAVGDSVELNALIDTMTKHRPDDHPLLIGSVKTNIGHAEAAAGIAGFIKAILIAEYGQIPASLHLDTPHRLLGSAPIEVVRDMRHLTRSNARGLIGISSFGISGTNVHAILAQPPAPMTTESVTSTQALALLVLSARSPKSLRLQAERMADYLLGEGADTPLYRICATAALHRDHHRFRYWVIGSTRQDIAESLRSFAHGIATGTAGSGQASRHQRRLTFVFPGQGGQWTGMARELMHSAPSFATSMRACDRAVRDELGWSVIDHLKAAQLPADVASIQPIIWAVQVALIEYLRSLGIEPELCVGHSMGEAAAAFASGALSRRESAAVICRRSRALSRLTGTGAMMVVGLGPAEANQLIAEYGSEVCVAAENAPAVTVLAGDKEILQTIAERLDTAGILARPVAADVASHVPGTEILRDELTRALTELRPHEPNIPMVSTVTARRVVAGELDADYWMGNVRNPVRFTSAIRSILQDGEHDIFVEISPHPLLLSSVTELQLEADVEPAAVATLRRDSDAAASVLAALGSLYSYGVEIDWRTHYPHHFSPVRLPTYSWDLENFCDRTHTAASQDLGPHIIEIELDRRAAGIRRGQHRYIPPVTFLQTIIDAMDTVGTTADLIVEEAVLQAAVDADDETLSHARLTLAPSREGTWAAAVDVVSPELRVSHPCVTATVREGGLFPVPERSLDQALANCVVFVSGDDFRNVLTQHGFDLDPAMPTPLRLWFGPDEAVALIQLEQTSSVVALEVCLLPLLDLLAPRGRFQPAKFGLVALHQRSTMPTELWSHVRAQHISREEVSVDIDIFGPDSQPVAAFRRILLVNVEHGDGPVAAHLRSPAPADAAEHFLQLVAEVLGSSSERIDTRRSLREHGLDSLMAVDLCKRLRNVAPWSELTPSVLLSPTEIGKIAECLYKAHAG
ncbi:type I polyketide synthase [Nocardia thailandica]|uniref:type I polyketide synthase n=1 Tax=Nocardia thailandica TaxID=257275 RepID=UPI0012F732EF|nr:type I polyketide synthase [Nocardia thailandica]